MTPQEKATELYNKFHQFTTADEELEHGHTIKCCLICIDEILSMKNDSPHHMYGMEFVSVHEYYLCVRKIIETQK